jgi:hypothetical protein
MSSKSSKSVVVIDTGGQDPSEYLTDLHQSISEVKMMIFERRVLDIDERQTFALYFLTKLQGKIVR